MHRIHITRKWILAFFFITALVVSVGSWYLFNKPDRQESKVHELCNSDNIGAEFKSKYINFSVDKTQEMANLIASIKATDLHDQSVNCLYILGKYNMFSSNPDEAVTYFEKLIAKHELENVWIDSSLGAEQPEYIKESIEHLKSQKDVFLNKDHRIPKMVKASQ